MNRALALIAAASLVLSTPLPTLASDPLDPAGNPAKAGDSTGCCRQHYQTAGGSVSPRLTPSRPTGRVRGETP